MSNPNSLTIFFVTISVLFLVKSPVEKVSAAFFKRILPAHKFPSEEQRHSKAEMIGERCFKLIINFFCMASLFKLMSGNDCDFMDVRVGGSVQRPLYYDNYPCQVIPRHLEEFYLFKISYHLYELGYTILKQRNRPDFPEYMLHHLMTWSLIFFSYSLNMLPIGAAVMILHDITDLTVTIFKITVDVTHIAIQMSSYVFMLATWIYFRLWYFPGYVIGRLYEECYVQLTCKNINYSVLNMLFAFLSGLACLHVFWFYLMVKGFMRRCKSKAGFVKGVSVVSTVNQVNTAE